MESITQLSLSDLAPDVVSPGIEHERAEAQRARQRESQRRYNATEDRKIKNRQYVKAWQDRQGEAYREKQRIRVRNNTRLRLYGITSDDVDDLLRAQGGICAVCRTDSPGHQHWSVDHDHVTGKIRGILCHLCNSAIGGMRDNPTYLRAAAEYLERTM